MRKNNAVAHLPSTPSRLCTRKARFPQLDARRIRCIGEPADRTLRANHFSGLTGFFHNPTLSAVMAKQSCISLSHGTKGGNKRLRW
jgi:hypothetical protein